MTTPLDPIPVTVRTPSPLAKLFKRLSPESFSPLFSLAALIALPLMVFLGHAVVNSGVFQTKQNDEITVPSSTEVPPQAVFAARLGECSTKGAYVDGARGIFMPTMLSVWVRNFDGWLMDRAEGNEAILKGSGFTPATYRNYLSLRSRRGSVQTWAEETAFREWVKTIINNPLTPPSVGLPDAASFAQMLAASSPDEKSMPVHVDDRMQQLHDVLLSMVKKNPGLLDTFKIADSVAHTQDTFKVFISERGMSWSNKLKDDNLKFQNWLETSRLNLSLTIGGQVFTSMKPDENGSSKIKKGTLAGQSDADTIQLLLFRRVAPAADEMQHWRDLVATYGVDSKAPITVSLRMADEKGNSMTLKMPSLVNGGAMEKNYLLRMPLRPVLMRSIGWAALVGVLWFIVLISMQTGTLRAAVPENHPEITNWTQCPWSATRVVFAWWLAICTGCYLFLWAMKAQMDVLSGSAPLLLGINGCTLLASSFVGGGRPMLKSKNFLEDIVSEGGEAEISRLQMLVWNGILGLVFIWQSLADWQMPTFDSYLTTLLGISSTAYVGYKATK